MSLLILLFLLVPSLLLVAGGVPLALGRVPPNRIYGFRTSVTLANREHWYALNRVAGRAFILVGPVAWLASACVVSHGGGPVVNLEVAAIYLGFVLGAAFYAMAASRRLTGRWF